MKRPTQEQIDLEVQGLYQEWNKRASHITWDDFLREKALFKAVEEQYYLLKSRIARSKLLG